MVTPDSPPEPRLEETKRISRVLRIIQLIGAQPRAWTRERLMQEFELSARMIDKDLELIRHGLCYDLRRGRGGYYFVGGPLLKPIELTVPEALALALAAQQARDTGTVDAAVIAGVLARLESALPPAIVPYLRRAAEAHALPFGPMKERGPVLTLLEQARAERRLAEIVYATASRGGAQPAHHRCLRPVPLSALLAGHRPRQPAGRGAHVQRGPHRILHAHRPALPHPRRL